VGAVRTSLTQSVQNSFLGTFHLAVIVYGNTLTPSGAGIMDEKETAGFKDAAQSWLFHVAYHGELIEKFTCTRYGRISTAKREIQH